MGEGIGSMERRRGKHRASIWGWGVMLLFVQSLQAQHEEQLEQIPEQEHARLEDDEAFQEREARAVHQLNLNTADAASLHALGLLSGVQVEQFLAYRQLLGALVSLYELQAVPGFDLPLIRTLLPYVRAGGGLEPAYQLKDYFRRGKHTVLVRYGRPLRHGGEADEHYNGSADKLLVRYRYQFSPHLSWGVVMEKDAGEQFFRGAQRMGFDHYGAHLFLRRPGGLKALALGDFTVNMGQGLVQWHGLSFGKSANVMQLRREGEVLRPYASAGEFYFYRGAGITLRRKRLEWTAFLSRRSLDRADSSGSLTGSGYHRNAAEVAKRGAVAQNTAGTVVKWGLPQGHVALNALAHRFSKPFIKDGAPYRLYGAEGHTFINAGIDYAATWRNVHFFGEAAVNGKRHFAVLQGLLAALHRNVDAGLVFRHEGKGYQAWYANAFGEQPAAGNESGIYAALHIRAGSRWQLAAYADVFRFPWLRYRIHAPTQGYDALVAINWQPDKQTAVQLRYQYKQPATADSLVPWQQFRCQLTLPVIARIVSWKCRLQAAPAAWLVHQQCEARWQRWRVGAGYTWFETGGEKAVYLAGQGFPGDNALARYAGTGWNAQLLVQRRLGEIFSVWCRWQYAPGSSSLQLQLQCGF